MCPARISTPGCGERSERLAQGELASAGGIGGTAVSFSVGTDAGGTLAGIRNALSCTQ